MAAVACAILYGAAAAKKAGAIAEHRRANIALAAIAAVGVNGAGV